MQGKTKKQVRKAYEKQNNVAMKETKTVIEYCVINLKIKQNKNLKKHLYEGFVHIRNTRTLERHGR